MIETINFDYEKTRFPVGEINIKVTKTYGEFAEIVFDYQNDAEIIELLMICDAIKRGGQSLDRLTIPYIPFGRQDRVNDDGESFSLKVFCNLINNIGAKEVHTFDPHSDVTTALLNNCIVKQQHEIFSEYFDKTFYKKHYLISPDGGALKKIYKLASKTNPIEVIECSKKRDTKTGAVTATHIPMDNFNGKDCYIVDDICDGGRTFIEIAKILKKRNAGKVILMVTHGFFTKGINVFDNLIDEIYTLKGRVK